ncbi:GT2 family glycosyltransferase [Prauserella shujinwangii]|uniref:GT2 family glycosyltransferase n=1 Tax=Prauserella shujinwangii TaxID=1453103 RepID=A0A2T0LVI9_9PSEU|nr:glycosyltransferase [Prauserella shujinwangii]PRX47845.1 GT2 family glycosyltransferase [Prauserella shujinwangii]
MSTGASHERLIEWTGERCVPWADDLQVIYEHYHRYAFALRYTAGKRVLDLASGEGFGAALLATGAAEVVGIDIDPVTVEHARRRYPLPNLRFDAGSIVDPDALGADEPFDVITCFEAIEHVEEHDSFMRLVRNRLAPGGVLLCSTPDTDVYTHDHGNENPYHVRELSEEAFRQLLASDFAHVAILRQNVAVGSVIHDGSAGTETHTLRRADEDTWAVEPGAPHTYLLGIASAEPFEVPAMSALLDPQLSLVARAVEAGRRAEAADQWEAAAELAERLRRASEGEHRATTELREVRDRERQAVEERDSAVDAVRGMRAELDNAVSEVDRLRTRADHDTARLNWLSEKNTALRQAVHEFATENSRLRAEHSALAQRLVGRYRTTVERLAPRGTRRRDLYETAMGRSEVQPAPEIPGPVAVTTSEHPLVTVVIPTYGNWPFTRRCLESIEIHQPVTPFEVIVVDDSSADGSAEIVAQCAGVRLVRTPRNLGFVGACNHGASYARGDLLFFLNNDTEVQPGWLDTLVRVSEDRPDVGLVGSKLVYPDGRLQECGGIVWSDGTGWNYGRGQSPDDPRYRSLRDVDYCSGAALLVRRSLFEQIGGFDERYAPAYYEDTDLAFAVRARGYRTVVQPESVVVHHEGVSNGTDVASGIKRHQELNRGVFADKWADALSEHLPEASPLNVWLTGTGTANGHRGGFVLVADHQVPRPDHDSGSVRMTRILRLLAEGKQRVVFFPMNGAVPEPYSSELYRAGITVVPGQEQQAEFLRDAGEEVRLALLSRPQVAWQLLEQIREFAPRCLVAYDTVDLHFLRLERQAGVAAELGVEDEQQRLLKRAHALRQLELGLVRTADVTLTVSDVEQRLLNELVPAADVRVLSNIHDTELSSSDVGGRSGILFVGGFDHIPNRDAADWLAGEIMPLIREVFPEETAHIVGSNPPPETLALAEENVVVHGWVEDLTALYRDVRVVVAPLRFGAGVKGKVGEALARGVPVVATSVAVEGMCLTDGKDVLVADTNADFAKQVVTLLQDDDLWRKLSEAGKAAVSRRFGPEVAGRTLAELLERTHRH